MIIMENGEDALSLPFTLKLSYPLEIDCCECLRKFPTPTIDSRCSVYGGCIPRVNIVKRTNSRSRIDQLANRPARDVIWAMLAIIPRERTG